MANINSYLAPRNRHCIYGSTVVHTYLSPTPVGVGTGTSYMWAVIQTLLFEGESATETILFYPKTVPDPSVFCFYSWKCFSVATNWIYNRSPLHHTDITPSVSHAEEQIDIIYITIVGLLLNWITNYPATFYAWLYCMGTT